MTVAVRQPMTLEQFLEWEEQQELRCEFDGFAPVAMTGGTRAKTPLPGRGRPYMTRMRRCRTFLRSPRNGGNFGVSSVARKPWFGISPRCKGSFRRMWGRAALRVGIRAML